MYNMMNNNSIASMEGKGTPSLMSLSGLPGSKEVVELGTSDDELHPRYRALIMTGDMAVSSTQIDDPDKMSRECSLISQKAPPKMVLISAKSDEPIVHVRYTSLDGPLSSTFINLLLSDIDTLQVIDNFLSSSGISCEKRNPYSNIYQCQTVINCKIVKFEIRLLPSPEIQCVRVEFRRTFGSWDCVLKVFDLLSSHLNSHVIHSSSRARGRCDLVPPLPSYSTETDELKASPSELNEAVAALESWLEVDPAEALQFVGYSYFSLNRDMINSQSLLRAVCKVLQKYDAYSDPNSCLIQSLSMACLRQFLDSSVQLKSSNIITEDHIRLIGSSVAKAVMGDEITARREASGLLTELNPIFHDAISRHILNQGNGGFCTTVSGKYEARQQVVPVF